MKRFACLFIALVGPVSFNEATLASEITSLSKSSQDEQRLWELERSYWRYVEANDLAAYRNLWHEAFLRWPSVSATPVRKEHITDWITSQTSKGLTFKTVELEPAAAQVTGDVAMMCYWITLKWIDKDENGPSQTVRITHAWRKTGDGWQIIGGMSMPEANQKVENQ